MKMEYTQAARGEDQDSFHGGQRKKKMKNKRFSDEQIRSLESRFEEETKLEPQKKVQLAKDLGLQPRQVAIWFQNKRARWKAKQLERQYNDLKANYDALASRFESLKEEKLCLVKQLQKLGDLIEKQPGENRCCGSGSISNSGCDRSENKDTNCSEYNQRRLLDKEPDVTVIVYKDGRNGENQGFEYKEQELQSVGETPDGSLLPEWSGFDSEYFSDQSCSSLQWWDLWHN